MEYRIVNKIICSLEGGQASKESENEAFQKCVSLGAQKKLTGLLVYGKDKPFTKEITCLGHDYPP